MMGGMADAAKITNKKVGFFLLLCAGLSLALCLEAARAPKHDLAWQAALFVRGIFGGLVALAIAWPYLNAFKFFHAKLIVRSLLLSFYTIWMFYAVTKVTSADVTTITSTQPIWIAILSMLFLKSKYSKLFWIAAVLVVIGMGLLVNSKPPETYGVILILLLFTIMRAVSIMMVRSMMDIPATVIALHYAVVVGILGVSIFFIEGGHNHMEVVFDTRGTALLLIVAASASVYQALVAKVVQILGSISGTIGIMIATVFTYVYGMTKQAYVIDLLQIAGLLLVIFPSVWIV
ncbi:MAG: EamA family transporter, partial [Phycisphaerales bacterium]